MKVLEVKCMKKFFITCLSSFLIGGLFAFYVLKDFKNDGVLALDSYHEAKAFQVGAFGTLESAQKRQNDFPISIIVKEDSMYRIYVSILKEEENIAKMEAYLKEQGIDLYLKQIYISSSFEEKLKKIETLLQKSNNQDTYPTINKEILKNYESVES